MATEIIAELTKLIDRWRWQCLHLEEQDHSIVLFQCFANHIQVTMVCTSIKHHIAFLFWLEYVSIVSIGLNVYKIIVFCNFYNVFRFKVFHALKKFM